MHSVAELLEKEEAAFASVVGDTHWAAAQRAHYGIGRLLAVMKVDMLHTVLVLLYSFVRCTFVWVDDSRRIAAPAACWRS